jgi:hypothetical protein
MRKLDTEVEQLRNELEAWLGLVADGKILPTFSYGTARLMDRVDSTQDILNAKVPKSASNTKKVVMNGCDVDDKHHPPFCHVHGCYLTRMNSGEMVCPGRLKDEMDELKDEVGRLQVLRDRLAELDYPSKEKVWPLMDIAKALRSVAMPSDSSVAEKQASGSRGADLSTTALPEKQATGSKATEGSDPGHGENVPTTTRDAPCPHRQDQSESPCCRVCWQDMNEELRQKQKVNNLLTQALSEAVRQRGGKNEMPIRGDP